MMNAVILSPLVILLSMALLGCDRAGSPPRTPGAGLILLSESSVSVGGVRLRAFITRPAKARTSPAVLFIQGYTCASVRLPLPQQKNHPYRHLVRGLSGAGFVVMRVEKSGVGGSGGGKCRDVDYKTDLKGFFAALLKLRSLPYVDSRKIVIFGHSMGGGFAAQLAEKIPVAGVMVYGAGFTSWLTYERENYLRQLRLRKLPQKQLTSLMADHELVLDLFYKKKMPMAQICKAYPRLTSHCDRTFYLWERSFAYFQQLAALDLGYHWSRVRAPVLAMWGSADITTSARDHRAIVNSIQAAYRAKTLYREFKDTDHSMERSDPSRPLPQFNSDIVHAMVTWMRSL
ncbi:alpha/beta hydrolase [Myxococcota bacterium]|nr:alpha/beta hydrolase [Myxococcota bacterium]MBU1533965.1 alpha/beta hydrolase [Myxococcota bacterium]